MDGAPQAGYSVLNMRPFRVRAVLFDFDGTLTKPGALDLPSLGRTLGCPADQPLLEWIASRPDPGERTRLQRLLEAHEQAGAARSVPNPRAEEIVHRLRDLGLSLGILTRNGRAAVERALENFESLRPQDFDIIVTRDTPLAPKPAPDGILHAASALRVPPEQIMLVGDYVLDLSAARSAGALAVLLLNEGVPPPWAKEADYVIASLDELPSLAVQGLPLPAGKLPQALLAEFLASLPHADPSLVVPPAVGEDVACVDITGGPTTLPDSPELLALKSDPITFASSEIPTYAVRVNVNDLVTSGALPRWFLATVLLPLGTTPSEAQALLLDLARATACEGLTLCGGHCEITDAVGRPVVVGSSVGVLRRTDLKDKRAIRPGDRVVLTKRVAVEGTALLAREAAAALRARGLGEAELSSAAGFLEHLGVAPEARCAMEIPGVRAMHDVTEGGLATALSELAVACGRGLVVDLDCIPYYPETLQICRLLSLDPLGLIGSGSLLIACSEADTPHLLAALAASGIEATEIAYVCDALPAVTAVRSGAPAEWPSFAVDEAARVLQTLS